MFGTVWNSVAEPLCGAAFCVSCWQQLMCTNNNYFNFNRFLGAAMWGSQFVADPPVWADTSSVNAICQIRNMRIWHNIMLGPGLEIWILLFGDRYFRYGSIKLWFYFIVCNNAKVWIRILVMMDLDLISTAKKILVCF